MLSFLLSSLLYFFSWELDTLLRFVENIAEFSLKDAQQQANLSNYFPLIRLESVVTLTPRRFKDNYEFDSADTTQLRRIWLSRQSYVKCLIILCDTGEDLKEKTASI